MTTSPRLLPLVSLPILALALGCCSNGSPRPATYSADRGPARPSAQTPAPPMNPPVAQRPYSAPIYRGQAPTTTYTGPTPPTTSYPSYPSGPSYPGGPAAGTTPSAPVRPAPLPTTRAGFAWSSSLREAQASARATGRLIFLEAGRDACGNCQHLKNDVIPSGQVNGELGSLCVGYYDDVDRDPYSEAFNILYANVQGAGTLPLCGWVTADLRWVHGFWGRREPGTFLGEMSTARSSYQRMAEAARPPSALELGRLPSAGSLPDAELADVSAELADERMLEPAPAALLEPTADAPRLAATEPVPAPAAFAAFDAPATANAPIFASVRPTAPPAPAASAEETNRTWVRDELKRAATELGARRYVAARAILAGVRERAAGLPESREADKAEVAIHNLRKIEKAGDSTDAARLRAAARRDLKDTVWMDLFA